MFSLDCAEQSVGETLRPRHPTVVDGSGSGQRGAWSRVMSDCLLVARNQFSDGSIAGAAARARVRLTTLRERQHGESSIGVDVVVIDNNCMTVANPCSRQMAGCLKWQWTSNTTFPLSGGSKNYERGGAEDNL